MIKEIPDKLARLPVMSIKLTLDIETIETEIEQEIVHSLMMEYIHSNNDCDVGVMISSLGNNGNLTGHLVNIKTGGLIYEGLVKESIIDTVC